ncbi:MAG: hypothetical protein KBC02_02270 [Candidatus Pacebacteria bacterium]|nr:hypothetical protein [Candidatus Paceibacterota bacterium]
MPQETIRREESDDTIPPVPGSDERVPLPKDVERQNARRGFEAFRERFGQTLSAYFGTAGIEFTFEPGGWYIDLEKLRVNADPQFFMDRGYSESEALFASFHEAEHFLDMTRDQAAYDRLFDRFQGSEDVAYGKALSRLYNCLDDILVNRSVMSRWASGVSARDALYPKLFPSAVLNRHPGTGEAQPRHRQFMYALLRRAMMPHEEVDIDPEVQEAIARAVGRGPNAPSLTTLITEVDALGRGTLTPQQRFTLIEKRIEPVFKALFDADMQEKKGGDPTPGGPPSDDFGDDPFEGGIPDPIDQATLQKGLKKLREKQKAKKFEEVMGVSQEDFKTYQRDYEKIKPYIASLAAVFDRVISRRIHVRRVLRKPAKEGVMVDPKRVAPAIGALRAGGGEQEVMVQFEQERSLENRPTEFEFSLVCDGSGSMSMSSEKKLMQRRLAVLIMEALALFRAKITDARGEGEDIRLDVRSSARVFSDSCEVIKPLSDSLTHVERVQLHKKLGQLPGNGNQEEVFFDDIEKREMQPATLAKLTRGDLKKIVLVLTDGESSAETIKARIRALDAKTSTAEASDPFVIAGIGFAGGESAVATYAPHGYYADTFDQITTIFTTFMQEILDQL